LRCKIEAFEPCAPYASICQVLGRARLGAMHLTYLLFDF
jgi:hypothetical protein